MASNHKSFPHYRVNVRDNSIVDVASSEVLPVHRPCYVIKAERGEIGKLVWCPDYATAAKLYGAETFNPANKKYFSLPSLFLKNTLTYNGAFIMRVADDTATGSSAVLEAVVTEDTPITQYQVDGDGIRVLERDPITQVIGYAAIVGDGATENGIKIQWRVRALGEEEEAEDLEVVSNTYPVMAFKAKGAGVYGNNLAFSLFYDKNQNTPSTVDDFKSVFYSLEMGEKEKLSSKISVLRSNFDSIHSFAVRPDAIDPENHLPYSMDAILNRAYTNSDIELPYDIYTYEENLCKIGNKIVKLELDAEESADSTRESFLGFINKENYHEFPGVTKSGSTYTVATDSEVGYMVNVISGINLNGVTYDHVAIDVEDSHADAATLQYGAYNFLQGGEDGVLTDDVIEEEVAQFFKGNLPADGSIVDKFRYPMTHIYDTGYKMSTKFDIIDFLNIRDDVVIELSTQDVSLGVMNDRMTDEANGEALRAYALLQRESIAMGTDCCRCAIYPQSGYLADNSYDGIVPFTFWSAMKHAQYGNLTVMSAQEPRGLPYSLNEYFRDYNWLNFNEAGQARVWDNGMNYCQAADMTRIFYPSQRTVYRADSSALTDLWFVDAIVYTKHVIRQTWATHVGRNDFADVLDRDIIAFITNELTALFNGKYVFETGIVTSEEERKLGYIKRVLVRITSPSTLRVLEVDVEVNRESTNVSEEQ